MSAVWQVELLREDVMCDGKGGEGEAVRQLATSPAPSDAGSIHNEKGSVSRVSLDSDRPLRRRSVKG